MWTVFLTLLLARCVAILSVSVPVLISELYRRIRGFSVASPSF